MNLGGLHRIHGKGIHHHWLIDGYRLHRGLDHRRNAWKSCMGVVFCTDDDSSHVVNTGLVGPQISSITLNQFLTSQESVVRTTILDDTTAAKSAAQCWAREKEAKVGAGVWMWWKDGSRSDDGCVGAAAVCKYRNQWRSCRSFLGPGDMEVFDAELWAIGLTLDLAIEPRGTLQIQGVKTVAVLSDSQAAIRWTAHLELGPGQRPARRINRWAQDLLTHAIVTEIRWVVGHSGIPGNVQADRQADIAPDVSGSTVIERPYTLASNGASQISERRTAAKARWEADRCGKHFSYRLKGKAGTKRPIPMTSMKLVAARIYRLMSGYAPTRVYLKRFGHRHDDKLWWCWGTVSQMWDHLFRHCSWWRDHQKELRKAVRKATGWKAGRCRHVQISELFCIDECDQVVMDFLGATEVRKFAPKVK